MSESNSTQIKSVRQLILSDLFRYCKSKSLFSFFKIYCTTPGFNYCVFYRLANHLYYNKRKRIHIKCFLFIIKYILLRKSYRFGIDIPYSTIIGPGLYIGHFGGIVVNGGTVIGKNCNLSPGVVIGSNNQQYARIGDNVYIAPGAKIIGGVTIGANSEIGANAVVTHDVQPFTCVAGVPAKLIKQLSSTPRYIHNIE